MFKAGFVGFGEINTPRDVIDTKVRDAKKLLAENRFTLVSTGSVI